MVKEPKLREIWWEEVDENLRKGNPKEAARREFYAPFYRSLEGKLTEKIKEMAQVIKEVAEFASKYRNHAAEVRLLLFEEKCLYETEYLYHPFVLCIWSIGENDFQFEVRDIEHDIVVAYLDIEPYNCYT